MEVIMKKVGIIPNLDKDIDLVTTKQLVQWIHSKQWIPLMTEPIADKLNHLYPHSTAEEIYSAADFLIVLGGDGTLLGVSRHAALHDTPVMGVNLGTLGFLTEVEKAGMISALECLFTGNYSIQKRMMLEASILTQSTIHDTFIALNDVGITRGSFSRIIDLHIYINDQFVDVFPADGIIISTPTGSTAYNLSAGGPILNPTSEMMVITPICPHTLYARSFVVSGDDTIKILIGQNTSHDILLTMDGQIGHPLRNKDIILIRKSKYYTSLIKTSNTNFYDILRKKIAGVRK